MSSCETVPTQTQFSTVNSNVVVTSFSPSITVIPGSTVRTTDTVCLSSGTAGTCVSSSLVTEVTTLPDSTSTSQIPFTSTSASTSLVPTRTLFSTSCTTTSDDSTTTTSTTVSVSTPTTTITSSMTSTLPDGETTQFVQTITSTLPPSSVTIEIPQTLSPGKGNSSTSSNLGPIIGGAVGGSVALIGVIALIWFFVRRRSRWDDLFEDDNAYGGRTLPPVQPARDKSPRFDLSENIEPKPYHYGLVGHHPPPPGAGSPPAQHERNLSTTPLVYDPGNNGAQVTSRTSVSASSQGHGQSGHGHVPVAGPPASDAFSDSGFTGDGTAYSADRNRPPLHVANQTVPGPSATRTSSDYGNYPGAGGSTLALFPPTPAAGQPSGLVLKEKSARPPSNAPIRPVIVHQDGGRVATSPPANVASPPRSPPLSPPLPSQQQPQPMPQPRPQPSAPAPVASADAPPAYS